MRGVVWQKFAAYQSVSFGNKTNQNFLLVTCHKAARTGVLFCSLQLNHKLTIVFLDGPIVHTHVCFQNKNIKQVEITNRFEQTAQFTGRIFTLAMCLDGKGWTFQHFRFHLE